MLPKGKQTPMRGKQTPMRGKQTPMRGIQTPMQFPQPLQSAGFRDSLLDPRNPTAMNYPGFHHPPPPHLPPPPLQQSHMSANQGSSTPVHISFTINPNQLHQGLQQLPQQHSVHPSQHNSYDRKYPTDYRTHPPGYNSDMAMRFRDDPPPYRPAGHTPPLRYNREDPPPPYCPNNNSAKYILESPDRGSDSTGPHHYPTDLQPRSDLLKSAASGMKGGRGGKNVSGKPMKHLSEVMPLGCEAASMSRNRGNGKNSTTKDRGDSGSVDTASVQSMPTDHGKNAARGGGRGGRGGVNRGRRGSWKGEAVGRGGSQSVRMGEKERKGMEEHRFRRDSRNGGKMKGQGLERSYNDNDDTDDDDFSDAVSVQSMPAGVRAQKKHSESERGRGMMSRGGRGGYDRCKSSGVEKMRMNDGGEDGGVVGCGQGRQDKGNVAHHPKHDSSLQTRAMEKGNRHNKKTSADGPNTPTGNNSGNGKNLKQMTKDNLTCQKLEASLQVGDCNDTGQALVKRLVVTMNIKTLFENVQDLKSAVRKNLHFPKKGKFQVDFKSETLLYKANVSCCTFEILTFNLWMAKKCVKNMVDELRRNLKIFVGLRMKVDQVDEDGAELDKNNANVEGKPFNKENKNVDKESKKETLSGKKSNGTNEEGKPFKEENKNVNKEKEKNSKKFQQDLDQKSTLCPVIFFLSVEKTYDGKDRFISFVDTLISVFSSITEFEIKEETIVLDQNSSQCSIRLASRADGKRLIKTICKLHKEADLSMKHSMTKCEQAAEKGNDESNETKAKHWTTRIEKILHEIEVERKETLSKHEEKIYSYRQQLEILESSPSDKDAGSGEENVIRDKLMETKRQKEEFLSACQHICQNIRNSRHDTGSKGSVNQLQKEFGVECQRLIKALPIYARRGDITKLVGQNQVSIILGETGSGKSTQIAPYLYEAGLSSGGLIVCTQPRKVAAVQLGERVAQEMLVSPGSLVGYKVGNRMKMNQNTKMVFMTDHSLLNECLEDRNFGKYSCIIVDEAHERSIYTDILLGMIKACLPKRPDLKVVITSATIDPQVFIEYFRCQKELRVSGRTYPVDVVYTDTTDDFEDYEAKAVAKAAEIHRNEPTGDILVFLSSPVEIMRCCEAFRKTFQGRTDFNCLPLHGQLSPEEQRKVFATPDTGVRKIVFSTNCAETSITIDGIKYVVDTGVAKEMRFDPKKNLNLLGIHVISQSSADQRKGRAGRTSSGKCFRLYSGAGYNGMEKANQPEILRVHLGQAILKLAELGIYAQDYDFVKSPSPDALQAAVDTLEYLGAVEDKKITERGRWISKLPFDPQVGYVVYEASKENLLYDAVVFAAVISNGSNLFYRGLTETEAQIAARSKSQFGHENGDILTWFAVYKQWEGLSSKEKSIWCRSNCLNYKCLQFVKKCVDDVLTVLSKEMDLTLTRKYSDNNSAEKTLSKLVFKANARSICHFLGHSKAGYFSLVSERRVHLHPSSTLAAQNLQPEWLVFTELVKTSREFIKGVLVVEEAWVMQAVDAGYLKVDIARAKQKTLSVVHLEEVGQSVFRGLVGPRFSHLQGLEGWCESLGMSHTILEADRDLGTVAIYSNCNVSPAVVKRIDAMKNETIKKLQAEETECKIFGKDSKRDGPNIRVVLGSGACVRQVLLPHQTTQVLIRKVGDMTEEDIMSKFGEFGNILEVVSFKASEPWGFIRYQTVGEANMAVEKTQRDETMTASLRLEKNFNSSTNMFEARVSWQRRPVKGNGTAFIKCSPRIKPALLGQNIIVDTGLRQICLSKNMNKKDGQEEFDQDLILFKIGQTSEDVIRHQIQSLLGRKEEMTITISRERVPVPSQGKLEEMKNDLKSLIDPLNEKDVNVWLCMPRESSCYQFGFLNFKDPIRGFYICRKLDGSIQMNGQSVKIAPSLKTVILVPKRVKSACEEQMNELFNCMKTDLGVEFEWKKLKENDAISIKCDKPEGIVKARECIMKELQGEVLDCSVVETCQCLLSKAGQDFLKDVQTRTGCVIMADIRTKKIHMYGKSYSQAMIDINKYLSQNESMTKQLFRLKDTRKPPGIMKNLMTQFGPLLEGLRTEYQLSSISINWKTHTLNCAGSETGVQNLQNFLLAVEESLKNEGAQKSANSMSKCVVCMEPVDSKDMLYRMEACGHTYCIACLEHQAVVCLQSNQLPLVCAEENCGHTFVWKDVRYILAKKWVTEDKLVSVSLNTCVSTQPDKYKFCPTPNCPVVYQVTNDPNGSEFNCTACFASTCSSCHVPFHTGVSCQMAKSATTSEEALNQWSRVDPEKRKTCPKCKTPIEKIDGCNKMRCDSCKVVFCWLCCQVFEDSQKCYAHLQKQHGGFY